MSFVFDVVAFAAHPDDAELFCGGTLIKMVKKGYKAGIVDLTMGERGTRGTSEIRAKEAEDAKAILGISHRENASIADTEVLPTLENRNRIIEILRRLRPRIIIVPYLEGRHPDHVNTSKLLYDASFFSGLKNYPLPGEPVRPFKIFYAIRHKEFAQPSFVVDITDEFEKKIASVSCYKSQFGDNIAGSPKISSVFNRITNFAEFCGTLIGKKYAEAFFIRESIEIDDPIKMTVPTF